MINVDEGVMNYGPIRIKLRIVEFEKGTQKEKTVTNKMSL